MALLESSSVALGSPAPSFQLRGVDDVVHTLEEYAQKAVLVTTFMCNHCPYVQACIDRLVSLQRDFEARGVQFLGINSNDAFSYPEDSFEAMKIFSRERGMNFPYLVDEFQSTALAYGAVCTPDIFVYDQHRRLAYHGRIDDNWKDASLVRSHDLRAALEALVSGERPDVVQKPSMGCSIKWRK